MRVSSTALILLQRNRCSVPCEWAHALASLRMYPFVLAVVVGEREVARHRRCFARDQTHYDWQRCIAVVQRDLQGFDFGCSSVDQSLIERLHAGTLIDTCENVVLLSGPGTGKTRLATAIEAVRTHQRQVRFLRRSNTPESATACKAADRRAASPRSPCNERTIEPNPNRGARSRGTRKRTHNPLERASK